MNKRLLLVLLCGTVFQFANGQSNRWQQRVKYSMDVDVDVTTNRIRGKQKLEYTNNSPDTLRRVFYHLYWNAFQPNSMMDVRSQELGKILHNGRPDWDGRVRDRISKLKEDEIGYQKIFTVKMNGADQKFTVHETILEVNLSKPILPGTKVTFDMNYESQVPAQVRRAGRDAANGVRYSMSQWYPKMAEYDQDGWHPNPYIAREFYGVWGDFDVKISIDRSYIIGGTGYLQNPQQIGYGYETKGTKVNRPSGQKLTWHFNAPNVHDFMWAADPDFKHITRTVSGGRVIHVLYNADSSFLREQFGKMRDGQKANYGNDVNKYFEIVDRQWQDVADAAVTVLPFIEKTFGPYPYKQYSFIHGGDGGMEYPMGTLLAGPGIGTVIHEWMHTWYQMMLGTNESLYAWMDEGFTEWATARVSEYYQNEVIRKRIADNPTALKRMDSLAQVKPLLHNDNYDSYYYLVKSGLEEPLTTHADHFNTNLAYSIAAYSKGAVFLGQLGYIVGDKTLDKIMLQYYKQWRYKHPNVNDLVKIAEKESKMELDWYKEYWVNSTKTIDYGIDSLWEEAGATKIRLKRIGKVPMPIDFQIEYKDGKKEIVNIPQFSMFGSKQAEDDTPYSTREPWKWTHPTYTFEVKRRMNDMKAVEIDPSQRMADVERKNNRIDFNW